MKTFNTRLTEKRFLDRLGQMCREKKRFDIGYNDCDLFVYKRKGNRFWLGKHYKSVGRGDGFATDRLNCKYEIGENGYVVVRYKPGKHPGLFIPHLVCLLVGLPIAISLIVDAVTGSNYSAEEFVMPSAFLVVGLMGFFRSKKELAFQEEQLRRICKM